MYDETFRVADERITTDTVFRLLSHAYRRALLDCLDDHGVPIAVADAAEAVAASNSTQSLDEIAAADVERVYVALHHVHVPMLAEAGVLEYDQDRNVVELTDLGADVVRVQNRVSRVARE